MNILANNLGGAVLTTSEFLAVPFEDWSDVRSPGRAARRRRQGHPQRIRFCTKPDPNIYRLPNGTFVGHPETIAALKDQLP